MFEFIKNLFRTVKTVQLRMIDINGKVTRNKWRAVVVIPDDSTSVDNWYRLNLKKINERRERWALPTYEALIEKHKGKKVATKEEFAELTSWDIKRNEKGDEEIYNLFVQVLDKIIETNEGDVEAILRAYEKFLFSIDQRAARYYPKIRKLNWIEVDKWWGYLADEARIYLRIEERKTDKK